MTDTAESDRVKISVTVNGKVFEAEVEPRMLLIDFLRDRLGFRGPQIGCDTTSCGACTVIVDDVSTKSCTMFAVQADGRKVLTIEGLAVDGKLHPIQEAFWEHHGLQCGYCTAGMVMSAYHLLSKNPSPTQEEVKWGLVGNLCRCTGYHNIVMAILSAAETMRPKKG
ncbi:MAG: (2Fe-2S)-binding protein [Nitrospinota bacterium]